MAKLTTTNFSTDMHVMAEALGGPTKALAILAETLRKENVDVYAAVETAWTEATQAEIVQEALCGFEGPVKAGTLPKNGVGVLTSPQLELLAIVKQWATSHAYWDDATTLGGLVATLGISWTVNTLPGNRDLV